MLRCQQCLDQSTQSSLYEIIKVHGCHMRFMSLHFKKMRAETRASESFDLSGLIISPPLLNTRSTGELDAGALRARSAG